MYLYYFVTAKSYLGKHQVKALDCSGMVLSELDVFDSNFWLGE